MLESTLLFPGKSELDSFYERASRVVSPIYLVGGCVRDALLGNKINDFDMTTPLRPDEIEEMIRSYGRKPYTAGKRFGTIGFKLDGKVVEVTTFRSEKYQEGSRKPQVTYVQDLVEDLARRDFTVNAIAYNKTLHDPFDGISAIREKKLISVGNPADRLSEDPLRMLRAARFIGQLNYECDPLLQNAIKLKRMHIFDISKERWQEELTKILMLQNPFPSFELMYDTGLLSLIFNELAGTSINKTSLGHIASIIANAPEDEVLRWAELFRGMSHLITKQIKPESASTLDEVYRIAADLASKYAAHFKMGKTRKSAIVQACLDKKV